MTPEEIAAEDSERQRRVNETRIQKERDDKRKSAERLWPELIRDIGRRYADATLDNFVVSNAAQREVVERLRRVAVVLPGHCSSGGGIAFIGPTGSGKDHLATAMLREAVLTHHMTAGWCDGQMLFQDFRDRMSSDELRERDEIGKYSRPDVLLISDPLPPSGSLTEYQQTILWRIIDKRYRNALPVWVTMNVANSDEAKLRLGPALVDRLRDGAVNIVCNWESHRKAAA